MPESTTRAQILEFIRMHTFAVQASVSPATSPQAAVVGFVATDDFQLFFDSVDTTRKIVNLRRNSRIAFVIGGTNDGDEKTVQYEGTADEPAGSELEQLKHQYFVQFPDGRERLSWPGLTYVRVRPRWLRFSDYSRTPPEIVELTFG
jgi:general stress protein 26